MSPLSRTAAQLLAALDPHAVVGELYSERGSEIYDAMTAGDDSEVREVLRVGGRTRGSILELACGTGIVTRELLTSLSANGHLTATDLNQAMIDVARKQMGPLAADLRLHLQPADACKLPFPDASFDVIVCQYGVMFFPDKPRSMREARRVLAPGGRYLFIEVLAEAHEDEGLAEAIAARRAEALEVPA